MPLLTSLLKRNSSSIARISSSLPSTTASASAASPTTFPCNIQSSNRRTLASIAKDLPNAHPTAPPSPPTPSPSASQIKVTANSSSSSTISKDAPFLPASLRLKSGETFKSTSFGSTLEQYKTKGRMSGEVVFTTSLVGYPESMTDPSYRGQILVFTQPLIGNYGVPAFSKDQYGLFEHFESSKIQCQGIVVNDYATNYSHWQAVESLSSWCSRQNIPAITGVDTRAIVSLLRSRGSTLGEIAIGDAQSQAPQFDDPNGRNLCAEVSTTEKRVFNESGDVHVVVVDCGVKENIIRCLVKRGAKVTVVPWNWDLVKEQEENGFDGVFLSNGPGDPRVLGKIVSNLSAFINHTTASPIPTPVFGICMGNLVLGMSASIPVYKLPFGNRGHNQPAIDLTTSKCVITSQNHGYALDDSKLPSGWETYFRNANDGSNEGIRHASLPFRSVQFHPEAMGGPEDTEFLFGGFVDEVRALKRERRRGAFTALWSGVGPVVTGVQQVQQQVSV
ncbi:Multifunctional pyrimidine synthesis protein CAD [Phlyctochytrium planicorne]|nr:Multifunctional pyrimidine synthesis protein CAD [Phlyctochytrium planicorne]